MNKIPCTMVDLRKAPTWTLTVLLLALVGCDSALQSTLAPASAAGAASPVSDAYVFGQADLAAAEAITAERMRRVIAELASDRYEGRAPGTAPPAAEMSAEAVAGIVWRVPLRVLA